MALIERLNISLINAAMIAVVLVGAIIAVVDRFQTKADAAEARGMVEKRLDALELQQGDMQNSLGAIAADVSYIRGRLEPRGK